MQSANIQISEKLARLVEINENNGFIVSINNLEYTNTRLYVSLSPKFRNSSEIKAGAFVIVRILLLDNKMEGEIVNVLREERQTLPSGTLLPSTELQSLLEYNEKIRDTSLAHFIPTLMIESVLLECCGVDENIAIIYKDDDKQRRNLRDVSIFNYDYEIKRISNPDTIFVRVVKRAWDDEEIDIFSKLMIGNGQWIVTNGYTWRFYAVRDATLISSKDFNVQDVPRLLFALKHVMGK